MKNTIHSKNFRIQVTLHLLVMVLKAEIALNERGEEGTVYVNHIEEMPVSDSGEERNTQLEQLLTCL